MSRRANAHLRCQRCRMHGSLCVCALLPRIETRTRVVVVIHRCEHRKPTNTGRLAALCLPNSEVVVRGHRGEPTGSLLPRDGSATALLFPHEGAEPVLEFAKRHGDLPLTMIVPDGTWRQASKVRHRVPGLSTVPCLSLPLAEPSVYRLRAEAHATGLATLEAIARALEVFEGPGVRGPLEFVFRAMVERTLWSRGEVETDDVTGGVPAGAMRHEPRAAPLSE
jgi:DTW domain-containing protein YfiP